MRVSLRVWTGVGIALVFVFSVIAYRSIFASDQIGIHPYGSTLPQRGDIVEIQMWSGATRSFELVRIDAVAGDTVTVHGRSEAVRPGYYYASLPDGHPAFVPRKYIVGRIQLTSRNR
jgi:hypothetical protein